MLNDSKRYSEEFKQDAADMSYLEPVNAVSEEIEIKKSRFISFAKKVASREEAMDYVSELRAIYPDARHVCWGYLIGDPNNSTNSGCNDDGEPSGTAGKPILTQINYSNIGNVVVVIARYFGGIRLGAGGLVRAYRESAQKALKCLDVEEFLPILEVTLNCPFESENQLRNLLNTVDGKILKVEYLSSVRFVVQIKEDVVDEFTEAVNTTNISVVDGLNHTGI